MALSVFIRNWTNRRRLLLFIFWYSLVMVLVMAYYSHVHIRWKDDSHLLRVYNSIFLPTPSPILRKHYPKGPRDNLSAPMFLRNIEDVQIRTARLKLEGSLPHLGDYPRSQSNFLELLKSNLSQFLIQEPSMHVQNLSNSLRQVKNALLSMNQSRTSASSAADSNRTRPRDGNSSSLSSPSLGEDKVMQLPGNNFHNSSYLIAAIEKNMQKIREETEISLKRLIELNEIINAPNETLSKSLSLIAGEDSLASLRSANQTQYPASPNSRTLPDAAGHSNGSQGAAVPGHRRGKDPKSPADVFHGTSRPLGSGRSVIRARAGQPRGEEYRVATPVPEVEGYYLMETRTKLRLHCKSCAVVSSSGQLLNKSAGAEIDGYPCVIRMNSAPISGFEQDVGSKTTSRVMGHVNLYKLNQSQTDQHELFVNRTTRAERLIIPWLFNTRVDKKKDKYYSIAKNFSKVYSGTQFYMLSSSKMALAENLFQTDTGISRKDAKTWLSTGWMTLIYALDICDQTDVFGLVHDKFCRDNPNDTTPYHYYEANGKRECEYYMQSETHLTSGHVFVTEKAVFARWAQKFNLNFRYPSWNISGSNSSAPLDTPFMKVYKEAQHNKTLQGGGGGSKGGARRHHALSPRSKKPPAVVGPKTKEDTEKEKYQRFTHAVMFIVAVFLSLVVFLLLFLLASLFVFCFYL